MAKGNVYDWITERFINALREAKATGDLRKIPWRRGWLLADPAVNLVSGKAYRGVNVLSLAIAGENYTSRYWLTAKQAKDRGGNVKRGEKSSMIVKWLVSDKTKNGKPVFDANGKRAKFFGLRYSNVFSVEQCEGIEYPKPEANKPIDSLEVCEKIIGSFTSCPPINYGGDRAYYATKDDRIQMPMRDTFDGSPAYYSTLFHECVHSTGHESRLDRTLNGSYGTSDYAREELVAEIGATMLCGVAGIEAKTIDNAQAYIENWLQRLGDDPKLIVTAAKQAQTAAEYMQGIEAVKYDNQPREESDSKVAQPVAA